MLFRSSVISVGDLEMGDLGVHTHAEKNVLTLWGNRTRSFPVAKPLFFSLCCVSKVTSNDKIKVLRRRVYY